MDSKQKTILITGGAGFIGSSFVREALGHGAEVVVLDALTYAGNLANLKECESSSKYHFVQGNICDQKLVEQLFEKYHFSSVVHFAAESHVDNSISGPAAFIQTNIVGTFSLLEASRKFFAQNKDFRFVHVSTDEVFGELGDTGYFTPNTSYSPRSPYSASKAGSDHLARAWFHTYGLPTIVTNCSNNYGPRQHVEKLIPRMISNALKEIDLPIYGKGLNIRDWIHVEDHSAGVWLALTKGQPGETYLFGGRSERKNIDVVDAICKELDQIKPRKQGSYLELKKFVTDRLGHDFRYAIDDSHSVEKLGFKRKYPQFEDGLRATIRWYLCTTIDGYLDSGKV